MKRLMDALVVRLVCPLCFEKVKAYWAFDHRLLPPLNIFYFIASPSASDAILIIFVTLQVRDVDSVSFSLRNSAKPDTLI